MSAYELATAVTPAGPDRFTGTIADGWGFGPIPNGGYVACLAVKALAAVMPHPDPFTVTTHFLRRAEPGETAIEVEAIREGRAHSNGMAVMTQGGREIARVMAVYGDLGALVGPTNVVGRPPELPEPESLPSSVDMAPEFISIARRVEFRTPPETVGGVVGKPTGQPAITGWMRFADGQEPDAAALVLLADAMPPPVLNVEPSGWVPTLELTVHVRKRPAAGWLRARFQTRYLTGGYLEEDGEIWDADGDLVALSRQLATVLKPAAR